MDDLTPEDIRALRTFLRAGGWYDVEVDENVSSPMGVARPVRLRRERVTPRLDPKIQGVTPLPVKADSKS